MISEFDKEKVFWTQKMNLKLVKFMESRPNIWNPKHRKYTSMKYRDKTYAEFASQYGNKFSGQAVKDRWTNIRSTFAFYLRKMRTSQAKGNGETFKITWHLWEPCKFLLKINKKTETNKNESDSKEFQDLDSSSEDDTAEPSNEMNTTCQNIANGILGVFRGVQYDAFGIENTKHGMLGQLITRKLSQMSSYDAAQMSSKIMDILLLYHKDNPLNPNNIKVDS